MTEPNKKGEELLKEIEKNQGLYLQHLKDTSPLPQQQASQWSIQDLADNFTSKMFPGGDAYEAAPLKTHDAAHNAPFLYKRESYPNLGFNTDEDFKRLGYTPPERSIFGGIGVKEWDERKQAISDLYGSLKLYETTGALGTGSSNSFTPKQADETLKNLYSQAFLEEQVYRFNKNASLANRGFEDLRTPMTMEQLNSPSRTFQTPLTSDFVKLLRDRGFSFYGKLGNAANDYFGQDYLSNLPKERDQFATLNLGKKDPFTFSYNKAAGKIHDNLADIKINLPRDPSPIQNMFVGPLMDNVNPPTTPGVDSKTYWNLAQKELNKSNLPPEERILKWTSLYGGDPDGLNLAPSPYIATEYGNTPKAIEKQNELLEKLKAKAFDGDQVPASLVPRTSRLADLNGMMNPSELLFEAKKIGLKENVANAARAGARLGGNLAAGISFFNPEIRSAIQKNDLKTAGDIAVRDMVVGAAAAPVISFGAGAAQQAFNKAAPVTASQVLPRVAQGASILARAVTIANTLAAVSMLGGDTPMNRGAERAALDLQEQRAAEARSKAAQRGGGRWEINTPWGKINLPEGGFTESGGIFNAPQRPIGTRAIENGKDVYWSGADYGYQSKDSFETLKNKGTFRPIGTQALRNGQPVFWSGAKYGYQSKATHEQLKQQGKI